MADLPLRAVWYATGNNIVLRADTARRCCHIRLESPDENPEERGGFRIPRLTEYAREHRLELLTAALTMLRWYVTATPPVRALSPWGSFEGWTARIRNTVVAARCPDPGATRRQLADAADTDAAALRALFEAWPSVDWHDEGVTTACIAQRVAQNDQRCATMRDALLEICETAHARDLTARRVGTALRKFRGRVMGTRRLSFREGGARERYWYIESCAANCDDMGN